MYVHVFIVISPLVSLLSCLGLGACYVCSFSMSLLLYYLVGTIPPRIPGRPCSRARSSPLSARCPRQCPTVGFHNFNLRIFNLRVSNPNKLSVDVFSTRCGISMCQGLGPKNTMKFRKSTVLGETSPRGLRRLPLLARRSVAPRPQHEGRGKYYYIVFKYVKIVYLNTGKLCV